MVEQKLLSDIKEFSKSICVIRYSRKIHILE